MKRHRSVSATSENVASLTSAGHHTRTGTAAALVVRAPLIVDALREYFDLLWDRATPITAPGCPQQARTSCRLPSGGCWS